ncbi:hypothetical protein D9757_005204 [Collybiopsis confluens]|uniref:Uncharacterized protein n=1 Tax=Collybiopsis confluens TaxID=2823264 RepID=A0A8H5HVR8_9AGAR|nr:hypothetical protein D9757_005204 [Collybiopsis confluens]
MSVNCSFDFPQNLTRLIFMLEQIKMRDADIWISRFTGKKYWFKNVPSKGATKLLLPEQLRKTFMHKQIVCVEYTELKFTDEQDLFKRVQQGVALTSSEKLGVISTVRVDFVRDLLNTYVPNGTFGDIPWETKRGVDLAVFSHVVRCIEMWGTSQGQEKTLPSLRVQSLEGWLEGIISQQLFILGNTEIRPDIRTYTRNTVDLLVKIVSRPKYNQPFSMHKKVAPIEMIFIMLLVFARGILPSSDDRLDKRELSNQISEMRTFVRHRFAGRVSLNDQVGRGLLEFINQMEPKEVKKRKRKWEDMEARPSSSSGISKAPSSSSSRRKVAPPEESPLSSSPPLGSLPRVVSASLSQKILMPAAATNADLAARVAEKVGFNANKLSLEMSGGFKLLPEESIKVIGDEDVVTARIISSESGRNSGLQAQRGLWIEAKKAPLWERVNERDWVEFHQSWWDTSDEVTQTFHDLVEASKHCFPGVVLSGQFGLGKSLSLVYILIEQMSRQESTIFVTHANEIFCVNENNIWRCSALASGFTSEYMNLPDGPSNSSQPWVLVYAAIPNGPPASVYATSPMEERYRYWRNRDLTPVWIMNPWSWNEYGSGDNNVLDCMEEFSLPRHADGQLKNLHYYCGPFPLDIRAYLNHDIKFKQQIKAAARELDVNTLHRILNKKLDSIPDELFIVQRVSRETGRQSDDEHEIEFKSPFAADIVRSQWQFEDTVGRPLKEDDGRLSRACSVVPEMNVLGGFIFDLTAMQILSGRGWGPKFYDDAGHAVPRESLIEFFESSRFTDSFFNHPLPACLPTVFPEFSTYAPRVGMYNNIEDIKEIKRSSFYVPESRVHALFNAFFVQDESIATAGFNTKSCTEYHSGLAVESAALVVQKVKELMDKAYAQEYCCNWKRKVEVRYILVVPGRNYGQISWVMPQELVDHPDLQGEAYVQYMNTDAMMAMQGPLEAQIGYGLSLQCRTTNKRL